MQKKYYRILTACEHGLYLIVILFFAIGKADSLYTSVPFITVSFTIFLSILLIGIIGLSRYNSGILRNARSVFILSLLVIAAVHITLPRSQLGTYQLSQLYPFYYAVVILFASTGSGTLWLTALSLFLVSEFGWLINLGPWGIHRGTQLKMVVERGAFIVPHIGYVFAAGGIAYFVSIFHPKSRQAAIIQKGPGISDAPARGAVRQDTTSSVTTQSGVHDTTITKIVGKDGEEQVSSRDLTKGEELSSVVFFMSRNFRAYSALGFIYDNQDKIFTLNSFHSKSMSIIPNVTIPAGEGIVGNLAVEKVSFLSGNLINYNKGLNYYSSDEMINSVLAVPILAFENELLGALVVDSKDKVAFRDSQKEILKRFSHLAAALITNVRMRLYQERNAKHFQIFYEAAQQFTTVQHLDQVIEILFNMIDSITTYYRIVAIDFHPESTSCSVRKIICQRNEVQEGFVFTLNDGLYSTVLKTRQAITIDNFEQYRQQYYLFFPEEGVDPNIRSLIIIPLATAESYCRGVISIESNIHNQFQGELGQLLTTLVSNAAVAYQKAFLYQKMEMLATTDGLTQLYNHRTFQGILKEEVSRSNRYKRYLSLLIMDIDHFKNFNDTYGHTVGDLVLKEIAKCLVTTVRTNDIPARYGGEEFAVVVPETSAENAMIIGERIRQSIESLVITIKNEKLHVTVSIGCAGIPEHAATQQQIIDYADTAMYYSKEHGRNQITVYNKRMGTKNSG